MLRTNLSALRRRGLITDWHDRQIPPGAFWDDEIRQQLDAADIILLLISADFIDSDYCMNFEVKQAYKRAKAGSATAIPVFYRHCHINGLPFSVRQGTPKDMQWICDQDNQDAAWSEVTGFIESAAKDRLSLGQTVDTDDKPHSLQAGYTHIASGVTNNPPKNATVFKKAHLLWLLVLTAFALGTWFWFAPFDTNSRAAKALLDQGDYVAASKLCKSIPPSAFREKCLTITSIALDTMEPLVRRAKLNAMDSVYSELLLAEMDINEGKYQTALARYDQVNAKQPDIPQMHFGVGRVSHLLNKPEEALIHYSQALGTGKSILKRLEHSGYALNIAGALIDAGRYEEAVIAYRQLLKKDKSVIFAHLQLVRALVAQNKIAEAQQQVIAAQNVFEKISINVLQGKQHNSEPWWYMGEQGKPVSLGGWDEKNQYMEKIFGSAFSATSH